ncbi:5-methylcytosine restriction system specificity protein McrC [Flavobacterium sp. RS13.1]|uniref:5-methylcytosine restriction system specificity protein McrC n=1 Tax=Flavobacterium sp. RS13.1 TaxID=3400345 RepID=UPI003AAA68FD
MMRISIPTNHNFYEESPLTENQLIEKFGMLLEQDCDTIKSNFFTSTFELTTKNKSLEQIKIFGFKNRSNKLEEEEQLILKLYSREQNSDKTKFIIQTGLFAGVLYHKGCQFNLTTPYGEAFLKRMLNFINDIYIDNQESKASQSKETNEFQNIIAYLFIHALEKASIMGLPKIYKSQIQRSYKVRGKVDVNAYLKHDFPFQGKLTTTYREQVYVQEIIDVLYLACKKLEQSFGKEIHRKIHGVFQLLKQNYSGVYIQHSTIEKVKNHNVLKNPMFGNFKNVLIYAEIILKEQNLVSESNNTALETKGYLFDISQLFEVYLEKLLSKHFNDWDVTGQEELDVYQNLFYGRKMFPDLVMKHKESDKIIVFDAKFKKMRSFKNDIDRSDFFQIHSYIQYYQPKVIFGGLLYPFSSEINKLNAHSTSLFGNENNQHAFIVDGIFIQEQMNMHDIRKSEIEFLLRIEELIAKSAIFNE